MSIIQQAVSTAIVCYSCLTLGLMYSWPSSTIRLFSSTNTTLNRPMTQMELALFGSLSSVSALLCTPLCGYLLDALGRKYTCIIFSMPQVIAWALVCIFNRVEAILLAVFISGCSGAAFLIAPVYVCEICQESIRGRMTSGSTIFYGIGVLVSYMLGGFMKYDVMNYTCLSLSGVGIVLISLIADSPTHLMKKGLERDAAKAIAFFRSSKVDSKVVTEEINIIRRALNPELDDETPEGERLKSDFKPAEKLTFFKFMKKSRSSRQAFVLTLALYGAVVFQGLMTVQVYAEPLFNQAIPNMTSTLSSILFALIAVISGFIGAYMADVVGRRPLMIYSSSVAGICSIMLGTQIHLHWGPHWLTAVFIYLYSIAYTFGAGTVPYVMVAEVFLPEIRSIASMLAVEWSWICNFIMLFIFNPLANTLGLGVVFYLFAAICFLSAIYSFFFLPETTGLTVDVIQTLFKNPRRKPLV